MPKVSKTLMLVILAGVCALVGGYLVGSITGIITPTDYIYGIRFVFNEYMVTFALIKSFVFAFMISTISCFKGYFTKGGALEVGISSTEAVTTIVIAVLIGDYLLAQLLL